ncbi:MAG: cell wall hydrolase [Sphingomonadales bacterium]|nr:cell wall hydrolase [Sphingomonadales bacterium]
MAIAIAAAVAIALVGVPSAPKLADTIASHATNPDLAGDRLPATPPPAVEPVLLMPVTVEDARAINAEIPFIDGPIVSARPFSFAGDADQRARAIDCLAAAMLYEAGDNSDDQRPVAQVVLNRVRHPAFPKTVCGVVFQGSERRTGCQFTFTCDGALNRRYSEAAWQRARNAATAALNGSVDRRVGLATHYHTDWVVPYWSDSLDKLAAIDTHLFFRWKGAWGQPAAFRSRVSGDEPRIARLATWSPAHGAVALATTLETSLDLADAIASAAPATTAKVFDNTIFVAAPSSSTPASLRALALAQCGKRDYCKLFGWTDSAAVPINGELTASARQSMAFSYLRDQRSGFERALFNCARFAGLEPRNCMKSI